MVRWKMFSDFLLFLFLIYFDGKVNSASDFYENSFEKPNLLHSYVEVAIFFSFIFFFIQESFSYIIFSRI